MYLYFLFKHLVQQKHKKRLKNNIIEKILRRLKFFAYHVGVVQHADAATAISPTERGCHGLTMKLARSSVRHSGISLIFKGETLFLVEILFQ
jgi:hypothetical protein